MYSDTYNLYGNHASFGYSYPSTYNSMDFTVSLLILVVVIVFVILWCIASYVMKSLSLFKIAKRSGVSLYGFAWVPILDTWVIGGIADKYDAEENKKHGFRFVLLIFRIVFTCLCVAFYAILFAAYYKAIYASSVYSYNSYYHVTSSYYDIFTVGLILLLLAVMLIGMGYVACLYIAYYKIFELCRPFRALLLLLLSAAVPFAHPFVLLFCMNYVHGEKVIENSPEPYDLYYQNQYYQEPVFEEPTFTNQPVDNIDPQENSIDNQSSAASDGSGEEN